MSTGLVLPVLETDHLVIPDECPRQVRNAISRALTVENPEYANAERYGRSTWNLSPTREYARAIGSGGLLIPRGAREVLLNEASRYGVQVRIHDGTHASEPKTFPSQPDLTEAQERAVRQALPHRMGRIVAPTGAGKTRMGLALVARRKQPTLWITHTAELATQASSRAEQDLALDLAEIGMLGGGKRHIGERFTIAMVQTLARGVSEELVSCIGHVVIDECHHAPAEQTASVLAQLPARYILGLSATPYRRDGLDQVIDYYVGPATATLTGADVPDRLVGPKVIRRDTGVRPVGNTFTHIIDALTRHYARNALIVEEVSRAVRKGRRCLVLTDRVAHVKDLACLLDECGGGVGLLHGQLSRAERVSTVRSVGEGTTQILVATGQLVGEGFDCPHLDTLFLATPISYHGRLTQYVGRILRAAPGKKDAVVIDYTDDHPMLWAQWRNRRDTYDAAGYPRTRVA
jgi:superfamily II DNA or RNA helicase